MQQDTTGTRNQTVEVTTQEGTQPPGGADPLPEAMGNPTQGIGIPMAKERVGGGTPRLKVARFWPSTKKQTKFLSLRKTICILGQGVQKKAEMSWCKAPDESSLT